MIKLPLSIMLCLDYEVRDKMNEELLNDTNVDLERFMNGCIEYLEEDDLTLQFWTVAGNWTGGLQPISDLENWLKKQPENSYIYYKLVDEVDYEKWGRLDDSPFAVSMRVGVNYYDGTSYKVAFPEDSSRKFHLVLILNQAGEQTYQSLIKDAAAKSDVPQKWLELSKDTEVQHYDDKTSQTLRIWCRSPDSLDVEFLHLLGKLEPKTYLAYPLSKLMTKVVPAGKLKDKVFQASPQRGIGFFSFRPSRERRP